MVSLNHWGARSPSEGHAQHSREACDATAVTITAHQETTWSGREDLNFRPPAPEAGALPSCATPRFMCFRPNRRRLVLQRKSGREDLNLRLLAPHASALPGCATPRSDAMALLQQGHHFMDALLQQRHRCRDVRRKQGVRRGATGTVRHSPARQTAYGLVPRTALGGMTLVGQQMPGAGNRIAIRIEQIPDLRQGLNVRPGVETLPRRVLSRLQRWKFRFPVSQYVRLHTEQSCDFANFEKWFCCQTKSAQTLLQIQRTWSPLHCARSAWELTICTRSCQFAGPASNPFICASGAAGSGCLPGQSVAGSDFPDIAGSGA